ncbi:MAG: hypothetical protein K2Z81_13650 [Cyanobacteria bacterium]|nr:hypothetical protein [Cyanobacteriota bacterium]
MKLIAKVALVVVFLALCAGAFILADFNGVFPYSQFWMDGGIRCIHFDRLQKEATPLEFLASLKCEKGKKYPFCRVWGEAKDWIHQPDVASLARVLSSPNPCLKLQKMTSSAPVDTPTTEGIHAFELINGYISGYYPPRESLHPLEMAEWLKKEKIDFPPVDDWCISRELKRVKD